MTTTVIAIGGNALIKSTEDLSIEGQYETIINTAKRVAKIIASGTNVVITHGNGPQVGIALYRSQLSIEKIPAMPFHYAVADTQGVIGYMFANALENELKTNKIDKKVVSLISRTLVDIKDPAFNNPDKPIGAFFDKKDAKYLSQKYGWVIKEEGQKGFRRVVASPKPIKIIELDTIKQLISTGHIVITCGGGGIPVFYKDKDHLQGIGAVIDKDRVSALLANALNADTLIIPTSVDKVYTNFGSPHEKQVSVISKSEAIKFISDGQFAEGSMLPKIEAMISFISTPKRTGIICGIKSFDKAFFGHKQFGTKFIYEVN